MDSELKAYLDKLRAETKALYDAWDKQFELHVTLLTPGPGVPSPPLTRSAVVASDGDLSIGTTVPVLMHDPLSTITQAREVPAVAHVAPMICAEMVPITCSTECSTEVVAINSVDEVHDAATTVHSEPAVNLSHTEVAQLIPVQATPSAAATTDTIPSVAMAATTAAMAAKTALTKCSAEVPAHASDWVQPLIATIDSVDETHDTATTERLHPPSLEHQPWLPPVQLQIKFKGSMSRPCPWPSFDCFHEVAQLKYTRSQPKINYVMNHFSGALNSMKESSRCRQSVQLKLQWSSFSSNC